MLFQILFYDLAHGLKHTNKHRLDAHFKALPRTETPALRRPPSFDSPADPPASPGGPDGEPPRLPCPLLNPSNYCYGNAFTQRTDSYRYPDCCLGPGRSFTQGTAIDRTDDAAQCGSVLRSAHPHPQMAAMTASNRTPPNSCWPLPRPLIHLPVTRPWAKRDPLTGEHLDGGGPLILLLAPTLAFRPSSPPGTLINSM